MTTLERFVGAAVRRVEGAEKVTGRARYAGEFLLDGLAYGWPVQSTIARGRVTGVDVAAGERLPGVLAVLAHGNSPAVCTDAEPELQLFRDDVVHYHGQVVALVVAGTLEQARAAADALPVSYAAEPHEVELSRRHPRLYTPDKVNPGMPPATAEGDLDGAMAAAPVTIDHVYRTPAEHNNPMEPHTSTARWDGDELWLYDSTQGSYPVRQTLAELFRLPPDAVHVLSEHVGGGFGSKGTARPNAVLAAMAARHTGRPVRVALSRQMLFSLTGYRTPTIQRIRLAAEPDGTLLAVGHDVWEQTSTMQEFAEQTATPSRMMYAAANRATSHRLARLDVPTPRWMRAPGECPGMYALESAMDELAVRLGMDPIELRIRNDPVRDPESGLPFSSRNLVACLRTGAEMVGWAQRDPRPAARRDGRFLVGTGVAASVYPARTSPSTARARDLGGGRYRVEVAAADIGTGARTALLQIAADALEVPAEQVEMAVGHSDFGQAPVAGGSMGTASWGTAVDQACRRLRAGDEPEVQVDTADLLKSRPEVSRYAFGAQFVTVRVDTVTGEVRVPRMVGVFAAGRIVNPLTARSQLIGGMTMGLSMALHEEGVLDAEYGDYSNHDLAQYHVAAHADVADIDIAFVDESDDRLNPLGIKGIGEIGIVGTAAALTNAVYHATGIRVRDLPMHPEKLRPASPADA
jgi:xanthine dehydrogenase YagR molybdenum-binding subunit